MKIVTPAEIVGPFNPCYSIQQPCIVISTPATGVCTISLCERVITPAANCCTVSLLSRFQLCKDTMYMHTSIVLRVTSNPVVRATSPCYSIQQNIPIRGPCQSRHAQWCPLMSSCFGTQQNVTHFVPVTACMGDFGILSTYVAIHMHIGTQTRNLQPELVGILEIAPKHNQWRFNRQICASSKHSLT